MDLGVDRPDETVGRTLRKAVAVELVEVDIRARNEGCGDHEAQSLNDVNGRIWQCRLLALAKDEDTDDIRRVPFDLGGEPRQCRLALRRAGDVKRDFERRTQFVRPMQRRGDQSFRRFNKVDVDAKVGGTNAHQDVSGGGAERHVGLGDAESDRRHLEARRCANDERVGCRRVGFAKSFAGDFNSLFDSFARSSVVDVAETGRRGGRFE